MQSAHVIPLRGAIVATLLGSVAMCWPAIGHGQGRPAPQQAAGPRPPARTAAQPAAPQAAPRQAPQQRPQQQQQQQQPQQQPPAPAPPGAPFKLTPQDQAALDRALKAWEQRSAQITTLKCAITRHEYDLVFKTTTVRVGDLMYKNPDHAIYRVRDPNGQQEWEEHWVCDGMSIYEYNYAQKELVERKLPKELQGKAIEDGPLPFLFNSNAQKLKARYWLRLEPVPKGRENEIWIEAFPKTRQDAANFQRAELILSASDLLPSAIQLHLPNGKSRTVHVFEDIKLNDPWELFKRDFARPKATLGWRKRVEEAPADVAQEETPRVPVAPSAEVTRRQQR